VIDGRGARRNEHMAIAYQTFVGQEVQLSAPHGLHAPLIMDARVTQQDGYRFVYVLPFSADRLLIEDTHYVETSHVPVSHLRSNIADYAAAQGWRIAHTVREEAGALPLVLAANFKAYWDGLNAQPVSGMRAGLFHATTGYSLPHAVRLAQKIASLNDLRAPALFASIRAHAQVEWAEMEFFYALNRMLFLAGQSEQRWRVMQRFYDLPESLIAHFYAGRLSMAERIRILMGKPPVPVFEAISALCKFQPQHISSIQ
jgi:lycopene beta-cyclase